MTLAEETDQQVIDERCLPDEDAADLGLDVIEALPEEGRVSFDRRSCSGHGCLGDRIASK